MIAQPSSDQVRRLAEAYKALAVSAGDLNEEEESALKLSEAVLASPEAPAKAWVDVSRGLFGDGWYVSIQGVQYPVQMVGAVDSEALALRMAGEIAAALGLAVRR